MSSDRHVYEPSHRSGRSSGGINPPHHHWAGTMGYHDYSPGSIDSPHRYAGSTHSDRPDSRNPSIPSRPGSGLTPTHHSGESRHSSIHDLPQPPQPWHYSPPNADEQARRYLMGPAPQFEQQPLTTTTTPYNKPKNQQAKPTPGRTMRRLSNAKDRIMDKTKKTLLKSPRKPNKEKHEFDDERGYYDARDSPPRVGRPLTREEVEEQEGWD